MAFKRLYIVTGKGGVGKTALSFSLAEYLLRQNCQVEVAIWDAKGSEENKFVNKEIKFWYFDLYASAALYLQTKLGKGLVVQWITKMRFFKTMLKMVPGMNYIIFLGQIWNKLLENPKLIIILDSPSSGHALTMLESLNVFQEIFRVGVLSEDIKSMKDFFLDHNLTEIKIVSIPTELAIQEASELSTKLGVLVKKPLKISLNFCFFELFKNFKDSELPSFLNKKIYMEKASIENLKDSIEVNFPYVSLENENEKIKSLSGYMKQWI
jgi:anion-transporting  ArsA/GET3 family ATPase